MIRDRIWESNKLRQCSRSAALAYPWIFLVADPWGRFEYNPRRIWTRVFGGREDVTLAEVEAWLSEYEQRGLLFRYHIEGELAVWIGFRDRPKGRRLPSQYPDPAPFMEKAKKSGSTSVKKVRPRKSGSTLHAMELDRDRDLDREGDIAPAAADAIPVPLVKPWNREAAELWWQQYKGAPTEAALFAPLKRIVKEYGWERVRPALVTYLAQTEIAFVSIASKFGGAFGTWEEAARGVSRAPPSKASTGDRTVAAMREFVEGSGDKQIGVLGGARQIGSGGTSDAGRPDADGLPRSARGGGRS